MKKIFLFVIVVMLSFNVKAQQSINLNNNLKKHTLKADENNSGLPMPTSSLSMEQVFQSQTPLEKGTSALNQQLPAPTVSLSKEQVLKSAIPFDKNIDGLKQELPQPTHGLEKK